MCVHLLVAASLLLFACLCICFGCFVAALAKCLFGFTCLLACLFVCLFVCLFLVASFCFWVTLFVVACLSVCYCLFVCLFVCLSAYVFLFACFFLWLLALDSLFVVSVRVCFGACRKRAYYGRVCLSPHSAP